VSLKDREEFKGINCQVGGFIHKDYDEQKYITSFGQSARIYSLANCIVAQAIEDSKAMQHYLSQGNENFNIGCIIANQYGV